MIGLSARAGAHLEAWRTEPVFARWREQVEDLVAAGDLDAVEDAFGQVLPFGTGGRRGRMGPGPNRMNAWTVAGAALGHARWLAERYDAPSVIIGFDVRHRSRAFAEVAAAVYLANGVQAHLQPASVAAYLTTPELSFAVRRLGASAGLMVTASHNPPADNGLKLYDAAGAQLVPPQDGEVMAAVLRAEVASVPDGVPPSVRALDVEGLREAFLARFPALSLPLRVVYTPLHGCGAGVVDRALARTVASLRVVEAQATPDPDFSTVPSGSANPEDPAVLGQAITLARSWAADLVLATDPDADRVGVAIPDGGGGYRCLSGDEIALLVVHEQLSRSWPTRPLVVQTRVTSSLVARMARGLGAEVVDDLPVGFKWIAANLASRSDLSGFAAAVEESHGVLTDPAIRDKDGAGGAVVLAQAAARAAREGTTLRARLDDIQRRWGPMHTAKRSVRRPGAAGRKEMDALLERLAAHPPATLGTWAVTEARVVHGMLVWTVGSGRVVVRPSGTEPRVKAYVEMPDPQALTEVAEAVEALLG